MIPKKDGLSQTSLANVISHMRSHRPLSVSAVLRCPLAGYGVSQGDDGTSPGVGVCQLGPPIVIRSPMRLLAVNSASDDTGEVLIRLYFRRSAEHQRNYWSMLSSARTCRTGWAGMGPLHLVRVLVVHIQM